MGWREHEGIPLSVCQAHQHQNHEKFLILGNIVPGQRLIASEAAVTPVTSVSANLAMDLNHGSANALPVLFLATVHSPFPCVS